MGVCCQKPGQLLTYYILPRIVRREELEVSLGAIGVLMTAPDMKDKRTISAFS